jgi:hypothetical protein
MHYNSNWTPASRTRAEIYVNSCTSIISFKLYWKYLYLQVVVIILFHVIVGINYSALVQRNGYRILWGSGTLQELPTTRFIHAGLWAICVVFC